MTRKRQKVAAVADSSVPNPWRSTVEDQQQGLRLDRWLVAHFPEQSRSALKKWIEKGCVQVDNVVVRASTAVRSGQIVEVDIPPPMPTLPLPENFPLDVLHEDDQLLIIDKPAPMVVHPSPGSPPEGTLVNALLGHTENLSKTGGDERAGIVHRLDRETSGVIAVAKTEGAHRALAQQFHDREVSKEYLALVHGDVASNSGEIDLPLGRSSADPRKQGVRHDSGGRESFTAWEKIATLSSLSWLRCFPRTGRTHQIRVHLRAIGHPIVCDKFYGREKSADIGDFVPGAASSPLLRHGLHAWRLFLKHPTSGEPMSFEAPLPVDLRPFWQLSEALGGGPERGQTDRLT